LPAKGANPAPTAAAKDAPVQKDNQVTPQKKTTPSPQVVARALRRQEAVARLPSRLTKPTAGMKPSKYPPVGPNRLLVGDAKTGAPAKPIAK
jgi:hypothetical protein